MNILCTHHLVIKESTHITFWSTNPSSMKKVLINDDVDMEKKKICNLMNP